MGVPSINDKLQANKDLPTAISPLQSQPQRQIEPTMLICTELDAKGEMQVSHGRFLKSTLCASHGLLPRDLRKLDGTLRNQLPAILVRHSAILVNLDPIKAIIRSDRVVLFEGLEMQDRLHQHDFVLELQGRLQEREVVSAAGALPFELQVLEIMLQRTLQVLQDEFAAMLPMVEEHLRAVQAHVHWERLRVLLECKRTVRIFQERVQSVRNCLAELLDSDDDMAGMYLSEKQQQQRQPIKDNVSSDAMQRPISAHEEVELMLESYLKIAEEILSQVQVLGSDMAGTEDIVNIGLVGQRNELLLLELKMGIGTFAAGMGGFGASILGMNLTNHMEHSPIAFGIVLSVLFGVVTSAFALSWRRMLALLRRTIHV